MLGVSVPRWHALLLHHLTDGGRPVDSVLVGQQFHGADLVGPMALLTVLLQDRSNVLGEGDGSFFFRLGDAGNVAALDGGRGLAGRLTGEAGLEGVRWVVPDR